MEQAGMELPDLSHLTDSERAAIEQVMLKYKEEQDKEKEVFKKKQDEVLLLETAIRRRSKEQMMGGKDISDLEATCQICLKTKFADGVGHICCYCKVKCCARCSGKVSLRSNKVIWLCIVCRKKQELVTKTGQWVQSGSHLSKSHSGLPTYDRDPPMRNSRLDRASSLEHEGTHNTHLGPPMSNSPTSSSSRRGSALTHSPNGSGPREFRKQHSYDGYLEPTRHYYDVQDNLSDSRGRDHKESLRSPRDSSRDRSWHNRDPSPDVRNRRSRDNTPGRDSSVDRHRDRRSSWDQRYRDNDGHRSRETSRDRREESSRDRCRRDRSRNRSTERNDPDDRYRSPSSTRTPADDDRGRSQQQHLDPNTATINAWNQKDSGRRVSESIVRNDSLSSDQSENVRPPPPKHRPKRNRKPRQRSFSSSEDEVRSTPEYSSGEEMESESISEKGEPGGRHLRDRNVDASGLRGTHHDSAKPNHGSCFYNPGPPTSTQDYLPKKTVRFHRGNPEQEPPWKDVGLPEQHSKDSGIDTSSSATLNEDTNNKHPVTWKVSADGSKLIGHILLKKGPDSDGYGMKVVGGKMMPTGKLGAVVEETRKDGLAERVGRIMKGDVVLQWNGRILEGKTYDEVHEIVTAAKEELEAELVINRPISNLPRHEGGYDTSGRRLPFIEVHPQAMTREGNPRYTTQQSSYSDHRPNVTVTSPPSPDQSTNVRLHSPAVGSRIQVKLWYDAKHLQLVVTIMCAVNLPLRSNFHQRNPYVKIVLAPDRREKCKRRTKTIAQTNEPQWNQTFVFSPLRRADLHSRRLEISMWDYDRYGANDFLGEVCIDLGRAPLDGFSEWYLLSTHEDNQPPTQVSRYPDGDISSSLTSNERMSPPSTTSRLSDSELSEGDFEDRFSAQTERRMMAIDGASFSSLGSSSSSPFLPNEAKDERRSRRDIDVTDTRSQHQNNPDLSQSEILYGRSRRDAIDSPETRGRSRSVAPGDGMRQHSSRRDQDFSSRSLSPPELRYVRSHSLTSYSSSPNYPNLPRQRSLNSPSTTRKRQLPQVPRTSSWRNPDLDGRSTTPISARYSARGSVSTSRGFSTDVETVSREAYDRRYSGSYGFHRSALDVSVTTPVAAPPRRGGGSRMAAALGVSTASPMVSPEIASDSETSSNAKYSINSAFETQLHKNSRTVSDFTTRVLGYSPVHPSRSRSKEKVDGSLSDTAVGSLTEKSSFMVGDNSRPSSGSGSYVSAGAKVPNFMGGLAKKSSSTSQLSVTDGYQH